MWTEIIWCVSEWNLRFQIPHCGRHLKWRRKKVRNTKLLFLLFSLSFCPLFSIVKDTVSSECSKDVLDVQVFTWKYYNWTMIWLELMLPRTWSGQIEADKLYKAIDLSLPEIACRLFIVVSCCMIERGWRQLHWKNAGVQNLWRLHPEHNIIKYASCEVFPSFNEQRSLSISKQRIAHSALMKSISFRHEYQACDSMTKQKP